MYFYKNGDRCPCCGQELKDKSEDWLFLFSCTVNALGLPSPDDTPAPARVRGFLPAEES